jgi:AcrR family transcriptional regulator
MDPAAVQRMSRDGRRERSERTRARIVDASAVLFIEHGYVATTIETVAERAGVAAQTVYYVFRTKRNLLAAVLDVQIAGEGETAPILEQSWVADLAAAPDAPAAVERLVERATAIIARAAPIYEVVRRAAADPEVAELLASNRAARRTDQHRLVELLARAGHLRPDLAVDTAADVLYALLNEEVWALLTTDRGWSEEAFRRWMTTVLVHELVA